ncbi:MAG: hypothetical protein IIW17_08480 [Clostridia bacterium]|nr:hypothetical protein [Clostridia bacterium]
MKKQKTAESTPNKLILPIFAALCALFASGAVVGITVLSTPALGWRLFATLLPGYVACFAIVFLVVLGYGSIYKPIAFATLPAACLACGVRTVFLSAPYSRPMVIAWIFALLCAACIAASLWALRTFPEPIKKSDKKIPASVYAIALTALAAALSLTLYTILLHSRLQTLQTGNTAQAEIGQMLYFMQHSGNPFTTLIAGEPQSYFATQFAPLWYVILPVYLLFGHSMLAVGIALYALLLTALIPLWRICRRHALSPWQTAALCAACALCPLVVGGGASGGALSMLSLPLILWIADAAQSKRPYLALIPTILCLCIGFEVSMWTSFVCLYLALIAPKEYRRAGILCTAVSFGATVATAVYLAVAGSPVITELFSGIGLQAGQKLLFLMLLLTPFALLPLLCKQKSALVLLFPLVLFHLVANASVFSGAFCTYAFPAVAAVALLAVKGTANLHIQMRGISLSRMLPALALSISLLTATPYVATLHALYVKTDEQTQTDAFRMHELLESLPDNAAVTASDSLLAALCERTWLFSLDAHPESPETNVVVIDLREEYTTSDTEQYGVAYYQSLGYTLRDDLSREGILAVLFK